MSDVVSEWLTQVEKEQGDECGNCIAWRVLKDDRTIEECPHCGDEAYNIDEVANKMEQLP